MVQVGPAAGAATGFRFVEWGAVIAGAVTAAALSFVFLTFGSAIGLSAVSPWPDSGVSAKTLASLAVFWTLAQQIGAFMIGGYIAGRMRTRWAEASADDTEFRDGLHGALVWAVGIAIGALMIFATAGSVAKAGADLAARATTAAAANSDSIAYYADALMRPAPRPAAATGQGNTKHHGPGRAAPAGNAGGDRPHRLAVGGSGFAGRQRSQLSRGHRCPTHRASAGRGRASCERDLR